MSLPRGGIPVNTRLSPDCGAGRWPNRPQQPSERYLQGCKFRVEDNIPGLYFRRIWLSMTVLFNLSAARVGY